MGGVSLDLNEQNVRGLIKIGSTYNHLIITCRQMASLELGQGRCHGRVTPGN